MKKSVKFLVFLVVIMVSVLPVLADEQSKTPFKVGDMMPDFTLKNGLTGTDVNFNNDIKGKSELLVVVFFNTGCSACMAEMDESSKTAKELGDDKVKVYGVAVDRRGEQAVKAYDEIYKFHVTYLLDTSFTMPPRFGFSYTPASLLLDKNGKIMFMKGGFDPVKDFGVIMNEIKNALKQPSPQ